MIESSRKRYGGQAPSSIKASCSLIWSCRMTQYRLVGCPSKYELERALFDGKQVIFRTLSGKQLVTEIHSLERRRPLSVEDWVAKVFVGDPRVGNESWRPAIVMFSTQSRLGLLVEVGTLPESMWVESLQHLDTTSLKEKLLGAKLYKKAAETEFGDYVGGLNEHDRLVQELIQAHHGTMASCYGPIEKRLLHRARM